MSVENIESTVAIGATDGYRYIGVKPPLTEVEIDVMVDAGVVASVNSIEQIDSPSPACTVVRCAGGTEYAQDRAQQITDLLRMSREGRVRYLPNPVDIVGHKSSPFNPNTDVLRHR